MSKNKARQYKLTTSNEIIKLLYQRLDSFRISSSYRSQVESTTEANDKHLTYGEINVQSFQQILDLVYRLNSKYIGNSDSHSLLEFVDLGSGAGKAVFCAALSSTSFNKCWGIEIVDGLHDAAVDRLNTLTQYCTNTSSPDISLTPSKVRSTPTTKHTKLKYKLDNSQFIKALMSILQTYISINNTDTMAMDELSNTFIQLYNHKIYRDSLNTHGKLTSFLKSATDPVTNILIFNVIDDRSVSFQSDYQLSLLVEPSGITTDMPSISADTPQPMTAEFTEDQLRQLCQSFDFQSYMLPLPELSFTLGSIFDINWWSTADVVYVASLLFSDDMVYRLCECVSRMRKGSWVISLRPLSLPSLPTHIEHTVDMICTAEVSLHTLGIGESSNGGRDKEEGPPVRLELRADSWFKFSWQVG